MVHGDAMKPDFSKFATLEGYYRALSNYWQDRHLEQRAIAIETVERLRDIGEIEFNNNGEPYWVASGDRVGG